MTDDPKPPSIRRVSAKDRKEKLNTDGALFESESSAPSPAPEPPSAERYPPTGDFTRPSAPVPTGVVMRTRPRGQWRYNLMALVFVVATIAVLLYFAHVWQNPFSPLNPLPPHTPLPIYVTATPNF